MPDPSDPAALAARAADVVARPAPAAAVAAAPPPAAPRPPRRSRSWAALPPRTGPGLP